MDEAVAHPRRRRPSASLSVATLALLFSLGGTAVAADGLITSRDIKNGTIRLVDLSAATKGSGWPRRPSASSGMLEALAATEPSRPAVRSPWCSRRSRS